MSDEKPLDVIRALETMARAEAALLSNAEAYRLVEEATSMRLRAEAAERDLADVRERKVIWHTRSDANANRARDLEQHVHELDARLTVALADLKAVEVERDALQGLLTEARDVLQAYARTTEYRAGFDAGESYAGIRIPILERVLAQERATSQALRDGVARYMADDPPHAADCASLDPYPSHGPCDCGVQEFVVALASAPSPVVEQGDADRKGVPFLMPFGLPRLGRKSPANAIESEDDTP